MLDNNKVLGQYLNSDGLLKVQDLQYSSFKSINSKFSETTAYLFKPLIAKKQKIWLMPTVNYDLMENLVQNMDSNKALVRANIIDPSSFCNTTGMAGASVYGVSFERAVNIAFREGWHISIFHAETPGLTEWGASGYLVIRLNKTVEKDRNSLSLQAWQGSDVGSMIYYIHAIFPEEMTFCHHLDGATMELDIDSKKELFYKGIYHKNTSSYQKQFRLDGKISWQSFFQIVKSYLIFDNLTNEYFAPKGIFYLVEGISQDNRNQRYRVPLEKLG
jgi:hypothetical protein